MGHMRNRLLWQVIAITALLLLTQQTESAKHSKKGERGAKSKKCPDCILVRVPQRDRKMDPQADLSLTRNFPDRCINPFKYSNISNPAGYPALMSEVICMNKCTGHNNDINPVAIKRNVLYLRREKNIYVLEEITVTVGCTCAYPEVVVQKRG